MSLVIAALLWGGVVSIALAAPTNTAWLQILQKTAGPAVAAEWGPALVGPAVEETLKFIGIIAIWLIARSEIDDIFDGFVYGAMIGLGFTVVEDVHYFIRFAAQAGPGAGEFGRCCMATSSASSRVACTRTCCSRASRAWASRTTHPVRPAA